MNTLRQERTWLDARKAEARTGRNSPQACKLQSLLVQAYWVLGLRTWGLEGLGKKLGPRIFQKDPVSHLLQGTGWLPPLLLHIWLVATSIVGNC